MEVDITVSVVVVILGTAKGVTAILTSAHAGTNCANPNCEVVGDPVEGRIRN